MKKLYTLILASTLGFGAFAQPVLPREAVIPSIGESYQVFAVDYTGFSAGAAGANANWDFSGLTSISSEIARAIPIDSSFGFGGSIFPNTNFVLRMGGQQEFFLNDGQNVKLLGIMDSASFSAQTIIGNSFNFSSNPIDRYKFPIAYQDTFGNPMEFNFQVFYPGNQAALPFFVTGRSKVHVDGYGTLTLPGGTTVENVIRINYNITSYTIDQDGNPDKYYIIQEYEYREAHTRVPLVKYKHYTEDGNTYDGKLFYIEPTATSIANLQLTTDLKIFPNPASNQLFVRAEGDEITAISIINLEGKVVKTPAHVFNTTGPVNIDLTDLSSGFYFAKIALASGKIENRKFIKQ